MREVSGGVREVRIAAASNAPERVAIPGRRAPRFSLPYVEHFTGAEHRGPACSSLVTCHSSLLEPPKEIEEVA